MRQPWVRFYVVDYIRLTKPAGEDYIQHVKNDGNILKRVGAAIKARRTELGISQEKLAEMSEVDRSFICGVERGTNNVSLITLCQITHALGVSFQEFIATLPKK